MVRPSPIAVQYVEPAKVSMPTPLASQDDGHGAVLVMRMSRKLKKNNRSFFLGNVVLGMRVFLLCFSVNFNVLLRNETLVLFLFEMEMVMTTRQHVSFTIVCRLIFLMNHCHNIITIIIEDAKVTCKLECVCIRQV